MTISVRYERPSVLQNKRPSLATGPPLTTAWSMTTSPVLDRCTPAAHPGQLPDCPLDH